MTNLKLASSKITKIEAERKPNFNGKIEITTNIKINSIEKIKEVKEAAKLSYAFEVDYGELGKIAIEGILFLSGDAKTIKTLLKTQKDKEFDSQEYMAVTNVILQKASIKAFELEEELGLPIHVKLPTLSPKNK